MGIFGVCGVGVDNEYKMAGIVLDTEVILVRRFGILYKPYICTC